MPADAPRPDSSDWQHRAELAEKEVARLRELLADSEITERGGWFWRRGGKIPRRSQGKPQLERPKGPPRQGGVWKA